MARGDISAVPAQRAEPTAARPALHEVGMRGVWAGELGDARPKRSERLSGKERAVLRALAHGHRTEAIADMLCVSPHTVRTHIKNGMRKLEARTRAHAVAIALSEGAIELEPPR